MRKIKIAIVNILLITCLAFMGWAGVSFLEINSKNHLVNPTYNEYNFFVVMNGMGQFIHELSTK